MAKNASDQNRYYLAEWLRAIRVQCGFSQMTVAKTLNVNRSTYTYYESGKTTPDPMMLHRIAQIYQVPIEQFFSQERPALTAQDPDGKRKRSPKKVRLDPEKVGQLSAGEKEIVAYLRDRNLSEEKVLAALKSRFGAQDPAAAVDKQDGTSQK